MKFFGGIAVLCLGLAIIPSPDLLDMSVSASYPMNCKTGDISHLSGQSGLSPISPGLIKLASASEEETTADEEKKVSSSGNEEESEKKDKDDPWKAAIWEITA